MGLGIFLKCRPRCPHGALSGVKIAGLAQEIAHAHQRKSCDAVAGRGCIVAQGFRAMHQYLMIVGGEEKAACLAVLKMREQHLEELLRERELISVKAQLLKLENGVRKIGIVIQIRIQVRAPVLVGREQAAVTP